VFLCRYHLTRAKAGGEGWISGKLLKGEVMKFLDGTWLGVAGGSVRALGWADLLGGVGFLCLRQSRSSGEAMSLDWWRRMVGRRRPIYWSGLVWGPTIRPGISADRAFWVKLPSGPSIPSGPWSARHTTN